MSILSQKYDKKMHIRRFNVAQFLLILLTQDYPIRVSERRDRRQELVFFLGLLGLGVFRVVLLFSFLLRPAYAARGLLTL